MKKQIAVKIKYLIKIQFFKSILYNLYIGHFQTLMAFRGRS